MLFSCCHCNNVQPYPDCFGCPVLKENIPQTWVLDLPTALSLRPGQNSSGTTFDHVVWNPSLVNSPYTRINFEYLYPSLAGFGSATVMQLDPKAVSNPSLPYTQCIWASNFEIYETEVHDKAAVPSSAFGLCGIAGLVLPDVNRTGMQAQASAWEHSNFNMAFYPQFYSTNRTRVLKPSTPLPACGSTYCGSSAYFTRCGWHGFGVYSILRIVSDLSGGMKFQLYVVFMPRTRSKVIHYARNFFGTFVPSDAIWTIAGESEVFSFWSTPWRSTYTAFGVPVPSYNWKQCFPYAVAAGVDLTGSGDGGFCAGIIAVYEKVVNCNADFTGNPVALSLVQEPVFRIGTPSKRLLLGLSTLPATVTITPV